MATSANPYDVRVGQHWQDCDKRVRPCRTLTVQKVDESAGPYPYATCYVHESGRTVRIRLSRFKPCATGYALISEVPR